MERFFTSIASALSVPIIALNLLGGIIGGVWLAIAGEWALFIGGLIYIFFGAMLLGILLMPSVLLGGTAVYFAEKNRYVLFSLIGLLGTLYTYGLIIISTYSLSSWVLNFSTAPQGAALLWLYAVVSAPWQYMASKEQENISTTITTFSLSFGIFVLIVLMGVFGLTLSYAFPFFIAVITAALILQICFAVVVTANEKKAQRHNLMQQSHKLRKRSWEDLE